MRALMIDRDGEPFRLKKGTISALFSLKVSDRSAKVSRNGPEPSRGALNNNPFLINVISAFVKTFVGTSENALYIQIWTAMTYYILGFQEYNLFISGNGVFPDGAFSSRLSAVSQTLIEMTFDEG
jgi:hypothetical protein